MPESLNSSNSNVPVFIGGKEVRQSKQPVANKQPINREVTVQKIKNFEREQGLGNAGDQRYLEIPGRSHRQGLRKLRKIECDENPPIMIRVRRVNRDLWDPSSV
ncbi:MAG: hypothetical protein VX777_10245 [Chlamydiota bacterium]|nr:hypothetical protein [Chlamydiota bacterium]